MSNPLNNPEEFIPDRAKRNCERGDHFFDQIKDDNLMMVEQCNVCGAKEYYAKVSGSIDKKRYNKNHEVDILQPFGATKQRFYEVYGRPQVSKARPDY